MKRRSFIRISTFTAGAWLLTERMPFTAFAEVSEPGFFPDPLLRITQAGKVTIFMVKQEMGQNVITSLPMIVAEELEINPKDVNVEALPFDVSNAGNYTTWASASISGSWMHLRKVGATARAMLVKAAAIHWKVDENACMTRNGQVTNIITREVLDYKELIVAASALPPPPNPPLKSVKDFRFIGQKIPKTNTSAITRGRYLYTMDVKLPDMLYAALVRCPVYHGKVKSWDSSSLDKLRGIIKIIPVDQMKDAQNRNAVAIIANNTWAALEGKRLLKVKWEYDLGPVKDSQSLSGAFKAVIVGGEPARVFGKAKNTSFKQIEETEAYAAAYELPFLAHAAMEPMNCTASYKNGKFEIWGGFQAPMFITNVLPKLFQVERSAISVNLMPMGGSFGRKEKIDNVADAMQLTRAMGVPVQMICTRVDDLQADFFRPASYHRLTAVSAPGEISKWRHQLAISTFPGKEISGPWHMLGGVTNDLCYTTGDYQSAFYPVESPVPLGSWRSIAHSPNVFAIESFIDELAVHHNTDAVAFRLSLLKENGRAEIGRLKNVLSQCAEKIGWGRKREEGRGVGIACCLYGSSCVAHAFEVSVTIDKLVRIHRCVAVVDCGLVIDPDGLKAQIEGSMVWALSGTFNNEITVTDGIVDQETFGDYQVLHINEVPAMEITLVSGGDSPGGGGEPGVPSVGPALCNALYAATGTRIRELPVCKHGFRLA